MICGPPHLIASIDRHAGYVTALQEAAVPPEPSRSSSPTSPSAAGTARCRRLLQNGTDFPEAVFAASDALAFGAMAAIQEAGLRVPDDIAVMGFDGLAEGVEYPTAALDRHPTRRRPRP